ncbi:acyl-CoA dehydrogenase family protein [Aeromicrobium sp.]|uniref:acyl-CoA dehydrogenase family protein n=1 Tax=Aeromicrobium sp. TaxID=1871063 RepID=UPI0019A95754|nr:acyl-CoA dehydrogenase family protein [Aeromicrobium sp.]MBC7630960.1 acyl-CoA dehydrogenase family protein [Aeromicrobium sp.]
MSFDFTLSPRVEKWRDGIADFVRETVIPREQEAFEHGLTDDLRRELQAAARAAGWWAPQAAAEVGGGGFAFDESAVLLEEAGYSLLGPLAINCAAPFVHAYPTQGEALGEAHLALGGSPLHAHV